MAAYLRQVYTALDEQTARDALEDFHASELGQQYTMAYRVWDNAWGRFIPFLQFGSATRKVIYTTNAIESLNYQLRKIIKNRSSFPNDIAAVKLLWLAICNIEDKHRRERLERDKNKDHFHKKSDKLRHVERILSHTRQNPHSKHSQPTSTKTNNKISVVQPTIYTKFLTPFQMLF
ncbi:hypothetical protein HMPREF2909_02355 [Alloscardovia sp. HMSC034E08]|nr:hypothetical protein HMPREF2909_02355 [Alloscardovia sp. HMSC034E08]